MALKTDTKFEGKLTFASKNDIRNFEIFHQHSKVWKVGLLLGPFIKNRKCMSLQFTEELCLLKIKNDAKIEENLACQCKIDMKNLMIFHPNTWKSQKFAL